MDNISLFTRHSFTSCIGNGYAFLAKQLLQVTRVLLPYFTVAALFCVLFFAYNTKLNVAIEVQNNVSVTEILLAILLYALFWATSVMALSRMFLMFRRMAALEIPQPEDVLATKAGKAKRTIKRTLQLAWRSMPYTIWGLIIGLPGFPVADPCVKFVSGLSTPYAILTVCGVILVVVIAIVFLIPLIYTFYCRMMQPTVIAADEADKREAFRFKTAYKKAFRHKGKIFAVTAWSIFLLVLVSVVLLLPALISTEAYLSSVEGSVNFNDTVLIGVGGYVMMFVSAVIAVTFCCLLSVAYNASLMYLFGDIYSKEK